jgi:hypothetical protein
MEIIMKFKYGLSSELLNSESEIIRIGLLNILQIRLPLFIPLQGALLVVLLWIVVDVMMCVIRTLPRCYLSRWQSRCPYTRTGEEACVVIVAEIPSTPADPCGFAQQLVW